MQGITKSHDEKPCAPAWGKEGKLQKDSKIKRNNRKAANNRRTLPEKNPDKRALGWFKAKPYQLQCEGERKWITKGNT